MENYLTTLIETLLSENGEMRAEAIAIELCKPLGNVRALLFCRKQFGCRNGRWGLREEFVKTERNRNF